ncbi:MAG: hypothetical protein JXR97_12315 [Planctomycetes bacterium]|nr:hypothetical protein [Planctomycetota bacterium]
MKTDAWKTIVEAMDDDELEEAITLAVDVAIERLESKAEEISDNKDRLFNLRAAARGDEYPAVIETDKGLPEFVPHVRRPITPRRFRRPSAVMLDQAILDVLADECGPLTRSEIISRLGNFGYQVIDKRITDKDMGPALKRITRDGKITFLGAHMGWTLTESAAKAGA